MSRFVRIFFRVSKNRHGLTIATLCGLGLIAGACDKRETTPSFKRSTPEQAQPQAEATKPAPGQAPTARGLSPARAAVTDDDLRRFAKAQDGLRRVQQEASAAENLQQAQQQVASKLEDEIRDTGLTMEEYSRIADLIRADRDQMERYIAIAEEAKKGEANVR